MALMGLLLLLIASSIVLINGEAKEGCQERCGDVSIPYPFGTNDQSHCYLSPKFLVTCNHSSNPPKLLLGRGNVQVLNISLQEGELRILNGVSHDCRTSNGSVDRSYSYGSRLRSGRFKISSTRNKFTVVGCDTFAWIKGLIGEDRYRSGCMSLCGSISNVQNGSCSGNGCCQTSIPQGLSAINLTVKSFYNYSGIWEFNPCGYAFVVEESYFNFSPNHLKDLKTVKKMPMVVDWGFPNDTYCHLCKGNSICNERKPGSGYLCNCSEGYQGNPYLDIGCQGINFNVYNLDFSINLHIFTLDLFLFLFDFSDINECEDSNLNKCEHPKTCVNTQGSHTCSCPMWYHGDGRTDGERCTLNLLQIIRVAIGQCTYYLLIVLSPINIHISMCTTSI